MRKRARKPSGTGVSPSGTGVSPVTKNLLITRRNLPHWQQGGATYFITFRVKKGILSKEERKLVLDACLFWHNRKWDLDAVVVLTDHVHLLARPLPCGEGRWYSLGEVLHSVKSFTAHQINRGRSRPSSVWLDESYDRLVRNESEFKEKLLYILCNPVKEGLADSPYEYPYFWQAGITGETPVPLNQHQRKSKK